MKTPIPWRQLIQTTLAVTILIILCAAILGYGDRDPLVDDYNRRLDVFCILNP